MDKAKPSKVTWGKSVAKSLRKLPAAIAEKFRTWVELVEESGIAEVRKIPGFHDEPLQGDRKGQRSIRLNRSYRAIYEESEGSHKGVVVDLIEVQEVNNHEY